MAQQNKEHQKKLLTEIMEADQKNGLYDEEPKLDSSVFHFSQEGNCIDGGIETLEIRCESSLGIDNDKGCFYVLKTEQWAFDKIDDLQKLINRISKVVNK